MSETTTTTYIPFPTVDVDLDAHGVTGPLHLVFRGDGSVGAYTQNGGRLVLRGVEYTAHVECIASADGAEVKNPSDRTYSSVKREPYDEAPPTYRAKILAAIAEAVEAAWTVQLDRAGLEASVSHVLMREERSLAEALEAAKTARAAIRRARQRLA